MEQKKMMAYAMVGLMLMGMLLSSTYSRADGPIYDKDSMQQLLKNESSSTPPLLLAQPSNNWSKLLTDPDEGGINVKNAYFQFDSDNLYFRMTSYNPWSSTIDVYGLIWVDSDCNSNTGQVINDIGADYWIILYGWGGYHSVYSWTSGGWDWSNPVSVSYLNASDGQSMETGVSWWDIGGFSNKQVVFGMIDTSTWYWDYAPNSGHVSIGVDDLSVESKDISFSAPIRASSDITVTAEIHNNNIYSDQKDVQVRFYMDRTSHIYHTVTIDSIPANGSAIITVPWHVPSYEGIHTVKVVVDPYNLINETDESNNMAETDVTVLSASQTTTTSAGSTSVMGDSTTLGLFGITMLLLVVFAVLIVTRRLRNR